MIDAEIKTVNLLPATRIDGDYCIVTQIDNLVVWGAETYERERAERLADYRLRHCEGMAFTVQPKDSYPGGEQCPSF